jgi:WD40 repeat protein
MRYVAGAILALAAVAAGENAEPPAAQRVDLYGDPLPDGALARMGSTRLHHAGLTSHVFLDGGKQIVTAGSDGVLRFWDTASGRQLREVRLQGDASWDRGGLLSPDGRILATLSNGWITFREVATGKKLRTIPDRRYLPDLAFSPDGKILAELRQLPMPEVGPKPYAENAFLLLHEWESGRQRKLFLPDRQFGSAHGYHGEFSPDGKWFAAGGDHGEALCVFERATWKEVCHLLCDATASVFSPDGKSLAVACMADGGKKRGTELRLYDLPAGREVAHFPLDDKQGCYSLAFSPDGKTLVCGFQNKDTMNFRTSEDRIALVDRASGRILHRIPGAPAALSFSPHGKVLAGSTGRVLQDVGQRLRLWDAATGKELQDRPGDFGQNPVLAISPDGRYLAAAPREENVVSLWDMRSGRLLRQYRFPMKYGGISDLAFSADGQTLVAAGYEQASEVKGVFQSWDIATGTGRQSVRFDLPGESYKSLAFNFHVSTDGKYVSGLETESDGEDRTDLTVRESATGKLVTRHPLSLWPRHCVWQSDGKAVALIRAHEDGLTLLDVDSGEKRFRLAGVIDGPLAASPDFCLLAAQWQVDSPDPAEVTVRVWETATGKVVAVAPTDGQTGLALSIAVAPDNRHLVLTHDHCLRVVDLATGTETWRRPFPAAMSAYNGYSYTSTLQLSPDGRQAVTTRAEGTALVWDLRSALARTGPPATAPDEKTLAAWWQNLAAEDAGKAYSAVWRMRDVPAQVVVPFLAGRLRSDDGIDGKKARQLIANLDSDTFAGREKASNQLKEMGSDAEPALRLALTRNPSAEARRRLESLVAQLPRTADTAGERRRLRAIQVLEQAGSAEARRILAELAERAQRRSEVQAAKEALTRLSR